MKRVILLSAAVMLSALPVPEASGGPLSVRLSVGGLFRYTWWKPPWTNGVRFTAPRTDFLASVPYRIGRYDTSPAPLAGFSVKAEFLKTWYFSSTLLFGQYRSRSASAGPSFPAAVSRLSCNRDIKQYDFDAHLGYQVNRYFGAYLCLKTRAYDFTEGINDAVATGTGSLVYKASAKGEHIDVGPGFGISVTVPMPKYDNICISFSCAGLVLATSSSYVFDYQYEVRNGAFAMPAGQFDKESFYSWCGQGTLALGYTLEPVGISFMLGGRYEVLYYRHRRLTKGFLDYGGAYDHSYGITFMMAYAVTLTGPDPVKL
ncbi:MAG TPA: hypothetical protein PLM53_18950 [Spirochaetota bacterium]|nr:hypothetical protein [Spirochaetota bacterium]HPC42814.1 hypothetical protein [Spirochaetota bacterium]HPL18007.1 hypothetical protein [Spirochaetota bacterium]HQF10297.1 hypothetical protein [Spirochaetota bacterium]HQH99175.1 hypothetical protein [Spirochaetota bacterium]